MAEICEQAQSRRSNARRFFPLSEAAMNNSSNRKTASYKTHKLIQDLGGTPGLLDRFMHDRERVFEEYAIPENERAALREASPPALSAIGLHPILHIHYFLTIKHPIANLMNGRLLDRLREAKHG
jgi:hypothetical protein